jgi:hypothetical protein
MPFFSQSNLDIYQSLFKGREDVFAIRWEKDGQGGYMPAYKVDWVAFNAYKATGGTFKTFQGKELLPFTKTEISKHLHGEHFIGVYPLLLDNTSWFIAADFDEANWVTESKSFLNACTVLGFPAYMEKSRSGKGAHVWLFFEKPYPAYKSRKICIYLLKQAGVSIDPSKGSSFDRLFPNQDTHSGKGFGNLIAIPLHKPLLEKGNNCFVDPLSLQPVENQWAFLQSIQRIPEAQLDKIYSMIATIGVKPATHATGSITIVINNALSISRARVPLALVNFLRDELNFVYSDYLIKKKQGVSTWSIKVKAKHLIETENSLMIPSGMTGKVLRFCEKNGITYSFLVDRRMLPRTAYTSSIILKDNQRLAVEATRKKDLGIISAPPGSGKTVMGLSIIAEKTTGTYYCPSPATDGEMDGSDPDFPKQSAA